MIGRWYAHLCAYDLYIIYVQGKTQVTADPLSRLAYSTCQVAAEMDAANINKGTAHQSTGIHVNQWHGDGAPRTYLWSSLALQ